MMNGEVILNGNRAFRIWLRSSLAFVLALQVTLGAWAGVVQAADEGVKQAAAAPTRAQVGEALTSLQGLLSKSEPLSDWVAFGLARSGQSVGSRYLPQANKSVGDGSLRLVTDLARVALAVNASGGNASEVGPGKSNLLAKIANFEKITAQGPNAPAYALLALDAAGYVSAANDRWSRDDLIEWLVNQRNSDGGWSLTAGKSDVDITAIVLTALAPYKAREDIQGVTDLNAVIDGAIAWLSGVQRETAGFGYGAESSESSVQVLIALTSLGIDPVNDTRFVKNGKSTLTRLLEYRLQDGQFSHLASGKADGMATFYALLGLTAVERWMDGLPGLYSGVAASAKTKVTVYGVSGQLTTGTATGKTALEALIHVLRNANISYGVDRHPQFGALLKSVAGVENGKFGGYDGWQYAVKRDGAWVMITEGMGTFSVKAGDELSVYYGGGETTLIHSVKMEPAAPREGQPVTVTVEKEMLDWDTGKLVVTPAEGAQVKAGIQTVLTDKDGKAQLKALKAGEYVLAVNGYRKDNAPLYVEAKTKLQVASYVKKVSVSLEGDAGALASGSAQGGTALEAVEHLLKTSGVASDIKDSTYGKYISSIGGITAGKYGGYDGWLFAVMRGGSWIIPAEGASTFLLEEGDEVVVYYSGDATKLADPIVVSPAQPKPGSEFTVTLTNRAWDWETNQFGTAQPLVGAKVKVGEVEAITDDKGQAKLHGMIEGLYTVEVTGYVKDGAPNIVRSVTSLPIAGSYQDQSSIAAWALEAATASRAAGLLRGISDGTTTFKPKQAVTRAEFVSALVRSLGLAGSLNKTFKDIPVAAWYAKDVEAAAAAGLVSGVGGGKFAPNATLTREQAAILLARALKLKAAATTVLTDEKQISAGAVTAVQAVLQQGWMTAYEGRFSPKASLSREQAAVIAVRIHKAKGTVAR
ncbi:S-layer homology domain-containing protein [Cohnella sp.]|uniref:S-layer homology domain-containing protein n=1 Tax=Cohnella sp. TaxID=1883426 RepID=UPI003564407C